MPPREERRLLLRGLLASCAAALAGPAAALAGRDLPGPAATSMRRPSFLAGPGEERRLSFVHTHRSERLEVAFGAGDGYLPEGLARLDEFLRDHRTGEVHRIDPTLLDLLHDLRLLTGTRAPFAVISGYRSPRTNAALRAASGGVAGGSLHMQGQAIDVRLPDVRTRVLRDAALELRRGGVGYYAASDFVHVDTGRVRSW